MNKDRVKRVQKYGKSLNLAPIIEPHSYYESDKHKRLKEVLPLEVKYQSVPLKYIYNENIELKDELLELKAYVESVRDTLTSTLIDYECNTSNIELKPLINEVFALNIIHPKKEYIGFKIVNGFIVDYGYDVIIEKIELPDEIFNGYFKYVDGAFVIDEDKFKEIWSVLL